MQWFPFYVGDYVRDTGHLSPLEHGCYLLLLLHYYAKGERLPREQELVWRIARARSEEERKAVNSVVAEFFVLMDDGYYNKRAERVMEEQAGKSEKARQSAQKRWHSDGNANAMRTHSEGNAIQNQNQNQNQNQSQEKRKARAKRASAPLPEGWIPSKATEQWCRDNGIDAALASRYLDAFTNICRAKAYQYADFDAAFRNCITKDWPEFRKGAKHGTAKFDPSKYTAELLAKAVGGAPAGPVHGDVWDAVPRPVRE